MVSTSSTMGYSNSALFRAVVACAFGLPWVSLRSPTAVFFHRDAVLHGKKFSYYYSSFSCFSEKIISKA